MPKITVLLLLVVLILMLRISARPGNRKTRARARELGLQIAEIKREIPVSYNHGFTYVMKQERCFEYLLSVPDYPFRFKLLQRFDKADSRVSNGWRLDVNGRMPSELEGALTTLMREWTEDFLEIEGCSRGVAAYWQEWGGAAQADRIFNILRSISSCTHHFSPA